MGGLFLHLELDFLGEFELFVVLKRETQLAAERDRMAVIDLVDRDWRPAPVIPDDAMSSIVPSRVTPRASLWLCPPIGLPHSGQLAICIGRVQLPTEYR